MEIVLEAQITPIKSGFAAHSSGIVLVGHGSTEDAALTSLRGSLEAWCRGLLAAQRLEGALEERGVEWTEDGELVTVHLQRN